MAHRIHTAVQPPPVPARPSSRSLELNLDPQRMLPRTSAPVALDESSAAPRPAAATRSQVRETDDSSSEARSEALRETQLEIEDLEEYIAQEMP